MTETAERITESNVFAVVKGWSTSGRAHLDLSTSSLNRFVASVVVNALLTTSSSATLRIKVGQGGDAQELLARNGLMFAVANRSGHVEFVPENVRWRHCLAEWRKPWTRGTRQALLRLGDENATAVEPSVWGTDYAAFVNPHRSAGPLGAPSGVAEVIRPWLHRLLPKLAKSAQRSDVVPSFVRDIGKLIDELVANVCDHAVARGSLGTHSLVLASHARGNDARVRHRLHITVVDTGPGIAETAAIKVPAPASGWTSAAKERLVGDLFLGRVGELGRARGFGLPAVWEIVRRWEGAHLTVITNGINLTSDRLELGVRPVEPLVRGTLVSVMVPLPPALRA